MKKLSILFLLVLTSLSINGQTAEELKKEQAPKKAEIAKLQGEVKALQSKIDALPGWRKGAFGTIGGSFSGFNNWYSKSTPTATAGNIGITVNGFANLIKEDFFWRNSAAVNLGWVKLDEEGVAGDEDFEATTDVFTISSLYGKRLNKKWALSGLAEYRTTIIDNFNDPGYLDLGIGATWTPTNNLVVVIHPGNYNFVFSSGDTVFESSLGAKIVADYTQKYGKLSVKSNLSMFQSYDTSDLSNWTFTNSFGYTIWKGIGVGFELGLRQNKQEALNNALDNAVVPTATFDNIDNKLQSYYLLGLSYAF
ncbi:MULTISPECIES: DUF3078 domain-containing protein [unclassified Polaribacter]|jgi:hypothetical protein|uniref:DUF3078 domain-containing protein n=1 Tax=unclassified Polaribacter TaxID=196858 RepID=UPI001C4F12D8|nr:MULTISPECIES: DUF3078 domain-containing protein [unclassified Polaribacter]QXP64418.1 DUF3078 domain-containing protein [Polaribacter sp. HaHaR_3_91]QXP66907.1 DUF3078 domain-containing protein [Polaribacter sp. AHE13PA]QXP69020.1 DUF3078 domain-containing protein [Polaribacter sp. R2A056_3_33]